MAAKFLQALVLFSAVGNALFAASYFFEGRVALGFLYVALSAFGFYLCLSMLQDPTSNRLDH